MPRSFWARLNPARSGFDGLTSFNRDRTTLGYGQCCMLRIHNSEPNTAGGAWRWCVDALMKQPRDWWLIDGTDVGSQSPLACRHKQCKKKKIGKSGERGGISKWKDEKERETIRGGSWGGVLLEPILELLYYRYLRVDLSSRFTVAYLTGGGRQRISWGMLEDFVNAVRDREF